MLTQSELKRQLHYDHETGIFTRLVTNSSLVKVGDIAGSLTDKGYFRIMVDSKSYRAHRLAWLYITGGFPIEQIDHINGVKTDNRLINLRDVTNRQNIQNQRKATLQNKSSGLLGVSWHKASNKWRSAITNNGKTVFLGYFINKNEAHEAYLIKKREVHSTCTI